jgi:hypothetical protein
MRIDVREHIKLAGLVVAFLDGLPVDGVIMADEAAGEILRMYQDSNGVFWPEMKPLLLRGKVEIKPGTLDDFGLSKNVEFRLGVAS